MPQDQASRRTLTDTQKWILGTVGVVVAVLAGVATLLVVSDDDETASTTTTTTTTTTATTTTTTTVPEETTTTTFTPAVDPFAVAFPSPESSRRFDTPESAARSYATDVLGFEQLVLDAGGPPSGDRTEVVVRGRADGPETRIETRRLDDGAWYVLGSSTPDIVVNQPTPGSSLATPFETTGEALAFEGTVEVVVLRQDDGSQLGSGTVVGSGGPPPGPFAGEISYTPPAEPTAGVLVYRVRSPRDGRVEQATSFPVRITPLSS